MHEDADKSNNTPKLCIYVLDSTYNVTKFYMIYCERMNINSALTLLGVP